MELLTFILKVSAFSRAGSTEDNNVFHGLFSFYVYFTSV